MYLENFLYDIGDVVAPYEKMRQRGTKFAYF